MTDFSSARIEHIYISPGHNFFGRHGEVPAQNPIQEKEEVFCVAGCGIEGDRFFNYKIGYKGQITFFAMEVYEDIGRKLEATHRPPSMLRRNVFTRGIDLNALVGRAFTLQGITFEGVEECRPCYWMDQAFAPGAEELLKGRGGLRARILNDGILRVSGARSREDAEANRT